MFDAARIMSGESPPAKDKCIIDYVFKDHSHVFTLMQYETGTISELVLCNLLFDNGLSIGDISDTSLKQRDNSCWSLEFAIHSKNDPTVIRAYRNVTFTDSRLWVSDCKCIKSTKWKHPYTEMANGSFNARPGHCYNSVDIPKKLIVVGRDIDPTGQYEISKINKYGFMQIETEDGLAIQHLNHFDEIEPEEVKGVWFNSTLNMWVFEDTDYVNTIAEECIYLLLDTHSRQPRFCSKEGYSPVYTYDYTKAKAFFNETEAINYAKGVNSKMKTTFTAEQWI